MQLFINNWASSLTLPASAAAVQLSVPEADAALLTGLGTGDHYLLTLAIRDINGIETAWEVVRVTGHTAGVLDVLRDQEGTTALELGAATAISARLTRATMETLRDSGGPALSDAAPEPLGAAAPGASPNASREDHAHALPTPSAIGAATEEQGALAASAVQPGDLADVAVTGDYADLLNRPPAVQSAEAGDVLFTLRAPGSEWVAPGSIQLQAEYPDLFELVGLIGGGAVSLSDWRSVVVDAGYSAHECIATDGAGVWIMGGAAAGVGHVLRSTDNGESWAPVATAATSEIKRLATDKAGNWLGVQAGSAALLRSTDNGASWASVTTQAMTSYDVHLEANGVAIAVGYQGKMQRSTDFGATWAFVTSGFSLTDIRRIQSDGAGKWVALGFFGKSSYSSNDGATFTLAAGTPMGTTNMSHLETSRAGVWLAAAGANDRVYRSLDNGVTWTRQQDVAFSCVAHVASDEWVGVQSDSNTVKRSFDGGQTWSSHPSLSKRVYEIALAGDGTAFGAAGWGNDVMVPAGTYPYNPATQFKVPEITAPAGSAAYVRAAS